MTNSRFSLDFSLIPSNRLDLLKRVASAASAHGLPLYIVGGFVRDLLLKRPVNDFDIVVEGDAIRFGTILVQEFGGKLTPHHKFHTAIWHLPVDLAPVPDTIDLITARSETYKTPGALPTVNPSTIEQDLRRRDFTVNAMALRLDGDMFGEMLDPLAGQKDLEQGLLRVLHPRSFVDDPTRILRSIRYEARYSFKLESSTSSLINAEALAVLSKLSGERIRHELDLILEEENSAKILSRLTDLDVFPSLPNFNKKYAPLLNIIPSDDLQIPHSQLLLGYTLWFLDSSSEKIRALAKRLDFSTELTNTVVTAIQLRSDLSTLAGSKPSMWTLRLDKVPPMAICALSLIANEAALKEYLLKWRHVKPHITGNDLKARGVEPGPRLGEILSRLRAAWLDGEVSNDSQEKEFLSKIL